MSSFAVSDERRIGSSQRPLWLQPAAHARQNPIVVSSEALTRGPAPESNGETTKSSTWPGSRQSFA